MGIGATVSAQLEQLKTLIPPPPAVPRTGWDDARREAGFDLPADYREFVDTYGAGVLMTRIVALRVHSPNPGVGLQGLLDWHTEQVRRLFTGAGTERSMWGGRPRPLFPDAGGLLAWGSTDESDHFFWLTEKTTATRIPGTREAQTLARRLGAPASLRLGRIVESCHEGERR